MSRQKRNIAVFLFHKNEQLQIPVEHIIFRLRQQNSFIINQIIHHLHRPLHDTARLIAGLHNRSDTEIIIFLHQLEKLFQMVHQTDAVVNLPVFRTMNHFQRLKALHFRKTLGRQTVLCTECHICTVFTLHK